MAYLEDDFEGYGFGDWAEGTTHGPWTVGADTTAAIVDDGGIS